MKVSYLGVVLVAGLALGGCGGPVDIAKHGPSGRYAGVGIYMADRTWTKMSDADKVSDKARSTVSDDQVVIVVVDSNTGELRQCGNMSGYCTGMNPWTRPLGASQANPVRLTEHAPEKTASRDAAADTPVSNEAMISAPDNAQAH
jgi:hypothetical protein